MRADELSTCYKPCVTGTASGSHVNQVKSCSLSWAGFGVTLCHVSLSQFVYSYVFAPTLDTPCIASLLVGCFTSRLGEHLMGRCWHQEKPQKCHISKQQHNTNHWNIAGGALLSKTIGPHTLLRYIRVSVGPWFQDICQREVQRMFVEKAALQEF